LGVTAPSVDSAPESPQRPAGLEPIRRYAIHLGLLSVALAVVLATHLNGREPAIRLNLPSAQGQAVVPTATPQTQEPAPTPSPVPSVLLDLAIQREAIPYTYQPSLPSHHLTYHQVEAGDTPSKVAELYGIQPATLLWGNPDLANEAQLLQIGITLTILPVDGVLHTVDVSDTVESLAEMYSVEPQAIVEYADNNLQQWPHRPVPGTQLIIPGGEKAYLVWTYTPNSPRGRVASSAFYEGSIVYAGLGRFIWPTWGRLTQYYWWAHRAIDIGAPIGRPVAASDSGTVIHAGWSTWGYGNLVVLDHGNGFQTWYGHLDSIWVANGQFVSQGGNIGAAGTTGNSSGPHLHFEIRYLGNLLNPLDYLQ